jgi:O-antigen/teichoic acid export membrane protein
MGYQTELGYYSAAYKINLIAIIPAAITVKSFFPQLSKSTINLRERDLLLNDYAKILFIVGTLVSVILFTLTDNIIGVVFGDSFQYSSTLLKILSLNVLLIFINSVYGNPLLAWNKQSRYLIGIGCGAIVNIILNFILIPNYLAVGAAIATISGEAVVLNVMMYFHWKETHQVYIYNLSKSLLSGVSAIIIFYICKYLNVNLGISFGLAIITLSTMLYITKLIDYRTIRAAITS